MSATIHDGPSSRDTSGRPGRRSAVTCAGSRDSVTSSVSPNIRTPRSKQAAAESPDPCRRSTRRQPAFRGNKENGKAGLFAAITTTTPSRTQLCTSTTSTNCSLAQKDLSICHSSSTDSACVTPIQPRQLSRGLEDQLAAELARLNIEPAANVIMSTAAQTPPTHQQLVRAARKATASGNSSRRTSSGPLTPVVLISNSKSTTPQNKNTARQATPNSSGCHKTRRQLITSPGRSLNFNWSQPTGVRTEKKRPAADRFIPARQQQDLENSQFHLSRETATASDIDASTATFTVDPQLVQSTLDSTGLSYQAEVARACGLALDKRVLNYRPESSTGKDQRSKYTRPLRSNQSAHAKRKICTAPERVLDAPGIADDYYLNLLDWSASNVLAVGLGSAVYLWNATSGTVRELCSLNEDHSVASLNWSPDGSHLAVADFSGRTHVWDVESSTRLRSIRDHGSRVGTLAWNDYTLSSGSRDGNIHHNDVRLPRARTAQLSGHQGEVCGLKWSFDGGQLASGGNDNLVNVWDVRQSVAKYTKRDHTAAVKALAWCPWQSSLLASGGGTDDQKICFWNTSTGAKEGSKDTGSQVTGLYFSKFYRELISSHGFSDNQLTLWKYPTMTKVVDIPHAHESRILHITMSPDGQTVCTGAADENLKFWRVFAMDPKSMKRKGGGGRASSSNTTTDGTAPPKQTTPDFGCMNIR